MRALVSRCSQIANGQLEIWFPPFNGDQVSFCKLDLHLATGQGIYVDANDDLYLNSPRPSSDPDATSSGIFKYTGPFPTSADASGGCGKIDNLGSPLVDVLHKERVLSAGDHGLADRLGAAHHLHRRQVEPTRDHCRPPRVPRRARAVAAEVVSTRSGAARPRIF